MGTPGLLLGRVKVDIVTPESVDPNGRLTCLDVSRNRDSMWNSAGSGRLGKGVVVWP